jgi:3-oxoadipate enol-lactonase
MTASHVPGPGLVLLHGTGGDGRTHWDPVVAELRPGRTVVRPTFAGSAGTSDGWGVLTVDLLAAQALAAADDSGLTTFDLVGYSLGAAVAARVAARSPQRVNRLVLVAGFACSDDPRMRLEFGLWRDLIATDHEAAARLFMLTGFSAAYLSALGDEQIEAGVKAGVVGDDWAGMARQVALDAAIDVRADLAMVTAPTLSIGCTQDAMVGSAHARAIVGMVPGAAYAEIDAGHLVVFEAPAELARLIDDFVT